MTYVVGQRASLSTEVRDEIGTLVDATVVLTVTAPDGTVSTPSVSHNGTGLYSADVTFTQAGDWLRIWSTSDTVVTTDVDQIHVIAAALRIVGLAEVKEHGNTPSTVSDRELLDFIGTAQQMIECEVGAVVPVTVVERHPSGGTRLWLNRTPVLSVTSVAEYSGITPIATLVPPNVVVDAESGLLSRVLPTGASSYFLGTELVVTYRVGRQPIPEAIRWAAKEQTIHLWRSTQALRGGRARGAETADAAVAGYGMPNRVRDALTPYLLPPAVA